MLPIDSLHLTRCVLTDAQSQPCAFKQLWFCDVPFTIATDSQDSSLAVTMRSFDSMFRFMKRNLLDLFWRKSCSLFLLHFHFINLGTAFPFYISRFEVLLSIRFSNTGRLKRLKLPKREPPSLLSLPPELRLKVFGYLVEEEPMRAVGYWNGDRDGFIFKQRGYHPLPVMLTCKQFYTEMHDIYFKTLSVTIKSASPSHFSGDMSHFTNSHFKDNIRKLKIADGDKARGIKIGTAFKNAQIEYSGHGASGSRKGAYYF